MERRFVPGTVVEHAGRRWRVERVLGADAALLRDDIGEALAADPARLAFPDNLGLGTTLAPPRTDELRHTDAEWELASRRRDAVTRLAALPRRTNADVDRVAAEFGLKRRQVYALLRRARGGGDGCADVRAFLPARPATRAKRLAPEVEAVVAHAIDRHYAKRSRPSLLSLSREIDGLCGAADLKLPGYKAVQARVRARDQQWLARRRKGPQAARALRLLTGAHPGAEAPWARVQIDSTPCDVRLVREEDRRVIGRATATLALDLYSRVIAGFSVLLEAPSTVTVAACLAHACLPKDDWLAQRGLHDLRWPVWGKPAVLDYDQGPENMARGIQRGLRLHGIEPKVRPKGQPHRHGHVERVIGTMMRIVHEWPGTTFSDVNERGEVEPDRLACLTLPELERALALAIDSYNHGTHEGTGERPMERYLAYYRGPDLPEAGRAPSRLPEHRLLLDFLPFETRPLRRGGVRLYRVDYSSRDLAPLWRRDNGRGATRRVVVYDPRSLTRVWVVDETTGEYLPPIPYRVPHPDMTLAESEEARRMMRRLKAEDRTERRLFENLAAIRAILADARTATARRKAERSRQARRGAREDAARLAGHGKPLATSVGCETSGGDRPTGPVRGGERDDKPPPWAGQAIAPIIEVERL